MAVSAIKAVPPCLHRSSALLLLRPTCQLRNRPLIHRVRLLSTNPNPALSGRTCLITGGSSGIGHAIAARFLEEGVERVILVGRSYARLLDAAGRLDGSDHTLGIDSDVATRSPEEDVLDTARETETPLGVEEKQNRTVIRLSERISLLVGDVGELSTGGWMRELEREMESVDILVNAAGQVNSSILARAELSDISQTLRTNLEGAILTSRALLRASIRARTRTKDNQGVSSPDATRPSKCIINISSLLAEKGGAGAVTYAASKAGILGLTRSLTVEASKSLRDVVIRSNVIVPGYIDTPMTSVFSKGEIARLKESIPLRRFGEPSEIADAAVFLARNEYANNCVLNLDGGLSAV